MCPFLLPMLTIRSFCWKTRNKIPYLVLSNRFGRPSGTVILDIVISCRLGLVLKSPVLPPDRGRARWIAREEFAQHPLRERPSGDRSIRERWSPKNRADVLLPLLSDSIKNRMPDWHLELQNISGAKYHKDAQLHYGQLRGR